MSVCVRLAAIDSGRAAENTLAMCVLGAIHLIRIPVQRGQGMRVGQQITGVNWAKRLGAIIFYKQGAGIWCHIFFSRISRCGRLW